MSRIIDKNLRKFLKMNPLSQILILAFLIVTGFFIYRFLQKFFIVVLIGLLVWGGLKLADKIK